MTDRRGFTLKELITFGSILVAVVGSWYDNRTDVAVMKNDIAYIKQEISDIRTRQANRFDSYDKTLDSMKAWPQHDNKTP